MKPGDVCRVRRDISSQIPWAAPGSIVLVTEGPTDFLVYAKLLFGEYRDEGREQYEEREGRLIFYIEELEKLSGGTS